MLFISFKEDDVININRVTCFKRISILLLFFITNTSKNTNKVFIAIINHLKELSETVRFTHFILAVPKFIISSQIQLKYILNPPIQSVQQFRGTLILLF